MFTTARNWRLLVRAFVTATALAAATTGLVISAQSATATTSYQIVGTGGIGVRARVAPAADADWDYGPPEGAHVAVICQELGDPMGAYGNDLWFYVSYEGREFFVPDTYTNSPHMADDPPLAGIDMCDDRPAGAHGSAYPESLFFTGLGDAGFDDAVPYASLVQTEDNWTGYASCDHYERAAGYPTEVNGRPVTTLSAYSLGRLAVLFGLTSNPTLYENVNYILLFDPGDYAEMAESDCDDERLDADSLLAEWLEDPANHLVIMSADVTEKDRHRGIQEIYFPRLRESEVSARVMVCNTPLTHEEVVSEYGYLIQSRPEKCPDGTLEWHP